MSGWRDADGHTAAQRKRRQGEQDRARFLADARHRPLSLVKAAMGFLFVVVLAVALIGWLF